MADELDGMNAEQLRAMLRGTTTPQTFDPNNPPRVPYVYREFPKMMYHRSGEAYKVANSKEEQDALGQEWTDKPAASAPEPEAAVEEKPKAAKKAK